MSLALWDLPYAKGSATSKAAATHVAPRAGSMRARILEFIVARGAHGATMEEIEIGLGMKHQTVGPRKRELETAGLIRNAGVERVTTSGCMASVWVTA